MAIESADIIPIFSFCKGKGLLSNENKPFSYPLVEISGIEPLTFPAVNAGKPPKADLIEMQEVSGCTDLFSPNEKDSLSAASFIWWR